MEVFVLMGSMDHEGDYLLGVYASEQEAVDALGVYTDDLHDLYYVDRRVLGAPAEYDLGDGRRYL
ncbi:hypothetical protein UFOVP447_118 [uncultured Caudovirales phage]|uniref:Uncharacterized protein n=1 Tax=uncultured Caudovirales phage TaxID=2100421 RepID=A0A6J5M9B8_9CAUD|nr:hypothetical protein UFOVP447_118 [uncultured Caudovirales phage]